MSVTAADAASRYAPTRSRHSSASSFEAPVESTRSQNIAVGVRRQPPLAADSRGRNRGFRASPTAAGVESVSGVDPVSEGAPQEARRFAPPRARGGGQGRPGARAASAGATRGGLCAVALPAQQVGQFAEAVRTARGEGSRPRHPPCQNARKAQKFTPVRGSSGESRLIVPVPQSRVPTTNICLATVASGAALDFVDFGGDLACNWLELGEDA